MVEPDIAPTARGPRPAPSRLRLVVALAGVALVQVAVIALGDSRFSSGSDAGGRAASAEAAEANGGCDHDLGYWAAEADPDGDRHPLVNTEVAGDGYVQPGDVLFICGTAAASEHFGVAGAHVIPVLGVLLAAYGAWLIDRHEGGTGWLALALVGGVGSVGFYGSDVWEHAPAAGAAVAGTALLLTRAGLASGVVAGALWGVAVSFRLETGVVAAALACVLLLTPTLRSRLLRARVRTLLFCGAAMAVVGADRLVERAALSDGIRDVRTVGAGQDGSGQVGQAASELTQRVRDVLVTNIGVIANDSDLAAHLMGMTVVTATLVLVLEAVGTLRSRVLRSVAVAVVVAVLVLKVSDRGFVPGMFVASPVAAAGAVLALRRRPGTTAVAPVLARAALLALPVIWVFQWTGSLSAQWGGRYQLTSAALLTAAGLPMLRRHGGTLGARVVVGSALAVGTIGLAWHVERTQDIAEVFDELAAVPCDGVLVSAHEFLLREGGGTDAVQRQALGGCRLLSTTPSGVDSALNVARISGESRATILYRGNVEVPSAGLEGWRIEDVWRRDLGRIPVTLVRVTADA